MKKAQNAGLNKPQASEPKKEEPKKEEPKKDEPKKDPEPTKAAPSTPKPEVQKSSGTPTSQKTPSAQKTPKPGPKSKTRPGPKSRTKTPKSPVRKEDSEEDVPDLSGDEDVLKPNKNYIRKRKKLVLTMEDLEPEVSDEEFTASSKKSKSQTPRTMPKRGAKLTKKTITDYFSEDDEKKDSKKRKITDFSDESD